MVMRMAGMQPPPSVVARPQMTPRVLATREAARRVSRAHVGARACHGHAYTLPPGQSATSQQRNGRGRGGGGKDRMVGSSGGRLVSAGWSAVGEVARVSRRAATPATATAAAEPRASPLLQRHPLARRRPPSLLFSRAKTAPRCEGRHARERAGRS